MWVDVGYVRARESPWFGVQGSLKAVLWLILIVSLADFFRSGIVLIELLSRGLPNDNLLVALTVILAVRLVIAGWAIHVGLNGLAAVRSFARSATWLLTVSLVTYAATLAFAAVRFGVASLEARALEIPLTFGGLIAVLVYVLASRRVNATYRYRLLPEEAALSSVAPQA